MKLGEVSGVIPGDDATRLKVLAESICRLRKVIIPAAVFPVTVPKKVPVGLRLRVTG